MNKLIMVYVRKEPSFWEYYDWCRTNCQGKFYTGYNWENYQNGKENRIVQFEKAQDAEWFMLRWS